MLGSRLRKARRLAGMKQVELAVAMGDRYSHSMVSMIEHGHRTGGFNALVRAAQVLGVSLDYLAGLTDESTPAMQLVPAAKQEDTSKVIEFSGEARKAIAVRELRTAAGAGALDLDESIAKYAYFRNSWLRKHELNPDRCCIIGVIGDSMEPTLPDGCAIMLDRNRKKPRERGIFVVSSPDGLVVKRVERSEASNWILASDNASWRSIRWPQEARIIGQVVWFARTLL